MLSGADDGTHSPGDGSSGLPWESAEDSGSNLVDPGLQRRLTQETVLLDLPREPIDETVFDSYTYTGMLVTSPSCLQMLVFAHFSLFPHSVVSFFFHLLQEFPPQSSTSDPSALNPGADTC